MHARIKRLTLQGFKSFYDRTELNFDAAVSAVVGPNGCGKSNISDAINWVLGEQSAKSLRGGKMEDVIFNGTATRKPLGMAEIALDFIMRDDEGRERENQVARRLYRTGESEYLINGQKVRLKDVSEFLHDLAIGARTYAVIEQGKIDEVLKAKPEERRELLEEAAGIAKFRVKKRSAELKLASTAENLIRLVDIIKELEAQLSHLRRQAQRAEQYRKLEHELIEARRFYFKAAALLAAKREHEAVEARKLAEDSYARAAAERAQNSAALEQARRAQEQNETKRTALQAGAFQAEFAIQEQGKAQSLASNQLLNLKSRKQQLAGETAPLKAQFEAAVGRAGEIARLAAQAGGVHAAAAAALLEAERKVETARAAVREAREKQASLNQALFMAGQRAARARADIEMIGATRERQEKTGERFAADLSAARDLLDARSEDIAAAQEKLQAAQTDAHRAAQAMQEGRARIEAKRNELRGAEDALRAAHREHDSLSSRRRSLQELLLQRADYSQEARHVLTLLSGRARGFADGLQITDPAWRPAIETLLGPLMEAVAVDSADDAEHAISELRKNKLGQVYLYLRAASRAPELAVHPTLSAHQNALAAHGALIPASRFLPAHHPQGAVLDRLGALAEDRAAAIAAHSAGFAGLIATRTGELLLPSGFLKAGGEGRSSLILKRQEDLSDCDRAINGAGQAQNTAKAARDGAEQAVVAAQHELEALDGERRNREQARLEGELRVKAAQDELNRQQRVLTDLETGHRHASEEHSALGEQLALAQAGLQEAEQASARTGADLEAAALEIHEQDGALEKLLTALGDLRSGAAVAQARLQSVEADRALAFGQRQAAEQRMLAAEQELLTIEQAVLEEEKKLRLAESSVTDLTRQLQSARDGLSTVEAALLNTRAELKHLEGEERMRNEKVEALAEELNHRRIAHATVENDRKHLLAEAREALGLVIPPPAGDEAAAAAAGEPGSPVEWDPGLLAEPVIEAQLIAEKPVGDLRERMRKLADRQQKFGPVNLMALDEFTEVEKRHNFMAAQKADLDSAIAELQTAIAEINATTRERFEHAFAAIAKHYQDIFAVLFDGGECKLKLSDENNVLESGIEIYAMPPGKKLTSLNLLSGGERALTTLAFLFAIFRYKPAPFCLMDETDAPLDDANVERYKRLLDEFRRETQFILITHNRATMSAADNLFGVTMEEPGCSKIVSVKLDQRMPLSGAPSGGDDASA